jgi:aminopeptidase N
MAENGVPGYDEALARFYEDWRDEALVVDKWFALQAVLEDDDALPRVRRLLAHPAFNLTNPNRVRSLLGAFAAQNLTGFHGADGAAYRLVADKLIEIDRINPQVAARLAMAFGRWRRFDQARQGLMQAELERIVASPGLSRDTFEIASKSLA